jgi:DNA-directed RNA polymerase specialized sigma subunit
MNEVKLRNTLNEEKVLAIRTEYTGPQRRGRVSTGPTLKELAEKYGVSAAQICRIIKQVCWKTETRTA